MSSARLLEFIKGGADCGRGCVVVIGIEYGNVVDEIGVGVENGGGVGRGGITLWVICSDTEARTS